MCRIRTVTKTLKATVKKDHTLSCLISGLRWWQRTFLFYCKDFQPYRVVACENHVSAILQIMGLCEASGQQAPGKKKTEHMEH